MFRRRRTESAATPVVVDETAWLRPADLDSWSTTSLFTVAAGHLAEVDAHGLVLFDGAALDTWIGAEDGWHLLSVEPGTRQVRLGEGPVVETRMKVPGGDITHRAWAAVAGGRPVVVVEVHNGSATPVGLAYSVRPGRRLPGPTSLRVEGDVISVDGRPRLRLDRRPAAVAAAAGADVVDEVTANAAVAPDGPVVVDGAPCAAAVVVPLAHSATVRLVIGDGADVPPSPVTAPDWQRAQAGWERHVGTGPRVALPDATLNSLYLTHRAAMAAEVSPALPGDTGLASGAGASAVFCEAGVRFANVAPVAESLPVLVERLVGTEVAQGDGSRGAAAPAWVAVAAQRLVWDGVELDRRALRAVRSLARDAAVTLGARLSGLTVDDPVEARGLVAATGRLVAVLRDHGEATAAEDLVRVWGEARNRFPGPEAPSDPSNGVPADLALAAASAARRGDGDLALRLLRTLAGAASATGTWPDRLVDGRPAGALRGDDPAASAAFLLALVDLLVDEAPDGLAVIPALPGPWWQRPVEAHGLDTAWGTFGFAVRWHEDRPVLLWEVEPNGHEPVPFRLSAPGIAPGWSSTETSGNLMFPALARPDGAGEWVPIAGEGVTTGGLSIGRKAEG